MKFSREITHEEMKKIVDEVGCVYVLTQATNEHGLLNKHLYRVTPVPVNVDGIKVNTSTDEWEFKLRNEAYDEHIIYPTLADVNEKIKGMSAFWEVGSYDEVIGWNKPEAVVLQAKQSTERVQFLRIRMKAERPSDDWKSILKECLNELEFLDKDTHAEFLAEIKAYEDKCRKYFNDNSPL